MRLIQHKREAYWFYRFLSPLYDRWVNPLFWTPAMRTRALELARLDDPALDVVDVGAGTGFSTEGIVERVDAARVTLLDQSPDQLGRAARKPALAECRRVLGDAERLPFETDSLDRWISCGSVEYWPEPQRAVAEAYRVLRPGGVALLVGPLPPAGRVARLLAELWMLFPPEADYRAWFERAGFEDVRAVRLAAPWEGGSEPRYGLAIAGRKPRAGEAPLALGAPLERLEERAGPGRRALLAGRFALGSLAGAAFVPIGLALNLRARRRRGAGGAR
jgi:MPBQ/MSBQ methyltransferase